MSGHTPGPWRMRCCVDRGDDLKGTDQYFFISAGPETWHDNRGHFHPDDAKYVIDEYEVVGLGFDRDYHFPEGGIRNEADARLIAAAPDLLAACRSALEKLTGDGMDGTLGHHPDNPLPTQLRDAIAKAAGR